MLIFSDFDAGNYSCNGLTFSWALIKFPNAVRYVVIQLT